MHMPSSEWWQWSPQWVQGHAGSLPQPELPPVNTGRTKSLTAMFISQPCWDPGNRWMDSLQRMFDRPLSSSSLSLSLGQMSGINHLGTTEKQHMSSHCSCAVRHQFRSWTSPKLEVPCKRNYGLSPPCQQVHPGQHQGSRKVGRRAGRREGGKQELTPGDRPGGFSCSITSPARWGRGDVLGVWPA